MTAWQALLDAAEAIRGKAIAGDRTLVEIPLAGVGWATVDAERTQAELDEVLGLEAGAMGTLDSNGTGSWSEQPRDAALGARVWLRQWPEVDEGPWLVVLEPDTEGRLAASLARRDEGLTVIYLGAGSYRGGLIRQGGSPWGPHVVILGGGTGREGGAEIA
jgi:hypothetical protein